MRRISITILSFLFVSCTAFAQEWSATFAPDAGNRIDYFPKKGGFKQTTDNLSYIFSFVVPAKGDTASIRLIPTGGRTQEPVEDYSAVVVHRSEDMLVLLLVYPANPQPDRFTVYTLYPKTGIGFSSATSAYIGVAAMKALSATKPDIPVATASMFSLRQISK